MSMIAHPPSGWEARKCVGTPLELWYGPEEDSAPETEAEQRFRERRAKALCLACPFRSPCLDEALQVRISHQWGIQGGLTAEERCRLVRSRRRKRAS